MIRKSAGQFAEAVEALSALERAVPRSALKSEAQFHRALALIGLGRAAEAEGLLQGLAGNATEPVGRRAALELATIQLEKNDTGAALNTVDEAMKRFPKSTVAPALVFRSAEALQKSNRPVEAQARFLKVLESYPEDPWADDAMQRAAQTALDRGDSATAGRLAAGLAAQFPQSPLRAEARLIEARSAALQGNPKEAVVILETLLDEKVETSKGEKSAPLRPRPALAEAARYELALAYRALGQSARAEVLLAEVAKGSTGSVAPDAQFVLGQAHLEARRYAEAIAPLESYLASNPHGDVADYALAHLAVARLAMGRVDDAWKAMTTLAERFPRSHALAATRLRLAEAELAAHHPARAAEQFRLVAGGGPFERAGAIIRGQTNRHRNGASAARSGPGPAWEGRCGSWVSRPRRPRHSRARAGAGPRRPKYARRLRWPRAALSKPASRPMPRSKPMHSSSERFAKSDQAPQAGLAQARLLAKAGRAGMPLAHSNVWLVTKMRGSVCKPKGSLPTRCWPNGAGCYSTAKAG